MVDRSLRVSRGADPPFWVKREGALTHMLGPVADEDAPPDTTPMDPVTLVVVLYTFRLVHAWLHNLPTDEIREDLIEAVADHSLWRPEYETDPRMVPGAGRTDAGPDGDGTAGPPRLKLVE